MFAYFAQDFQIHRDINRCSSKSQDLQDVIIYGNSVMLVINLVTGMYLLCKKHFARTEFVMLYILNLFWICVLFIFVFMVFSWESSICQAYFMTHLFTLIQTIKNELEILCVVYLPIHITNRFLTQCSDLIFALLFGYLAISGQKCKAGNLNMNYFILIFHVLFGSVGLLLNICSNLKKYHRQVSKGLIFLEFVMVTILVVIWFITYHSIGKISWKADLECQRLAVIQKSYLVLQPVAVLLMGVMALLRHLQKEGESKSIQENDQQQIHHIQMQEDDSYVSHVDSQVVHTALFDQHHQGIFEQKYGSFMR